MKPGPPYGGKKNGACFVFSEHGEDAFSCSLTSHPATDVEIPETNPDLMPFRSSSMPPLSRTELLLPQILYPTGFYGSDAPLCSPRTMTEHNISGVFVGIGDSATRWKAVEQNTKRVLPEQEPQLGS
uniref:Uncharacterized protein n=1 Tax=Micrurus carvalhoi TaxID=3147026 RepID=A0A2H6NMR7_9SAUR